MSLTADDILRLLAENQYVSGQKISETLGVSRTAVWKWISQLRDEGWQIESSTRLGYRLQAGDAIHPALWSGLLTTKALGRAENHFEHTVSSTNTIVKQMALRGAPHGSLCLCESQTDGKGRLGRHWCAPENKGLWLSVLLRPRMKPEDAPLITLCAAIAMARAVRETTGLEVRIKWPNDLVYEGRKLCGILLELGADQDAIEYVVVGTGLNVRKGAYPEELSARAAALEEFGEAPPRRVLLVHYLKALEDTVAAAEAGGFAAIEEEYRALSCTLGSQVRVEGSVCLNGTAEAIDEGGALLVRTIDGELRRVLAGDVSVRGVMGYV